MTRILVIDANPKKTSFIGSLAEAYVASAERDHEVRLTRLSEMVFKPDLSEGYDADAQMEDSLKSFQADLGWCQHWVIFVPVWWGAVPAKFKGLLDRSLLPGFAFKYEKGMKFQIKLLKGRTASIVMTMDTPPWYFRFFQGAPALKQLKITTLEFVGFKVSTVEMLGPIISSSEENRRNWLNKVSALGEKGA